MIKGMGTCFVTSASRPINFIAASDGTIMGEYGHLTADGYYITTVYSTDAKGKYSVMERRKELAGEVAEPDQRNIL